MARSLTDGTTAESSAPLARARVHFDAGRYQEAAQLCEQAFADGVDTGEALLLAGLIAERLGNGAAARAFFDRAVAEEPLNPVYRLATGVSCAAGGALDAAEIHLTTALKLTPNTFEAHIALGDVHIGRFRLNEARTHYEAAHALRPGSVEAIIKLSNIHRLLGDYEAAFTWIDNALEIDPENVGANWNRALLLLATGQLESGFAAYEWRWRSKEFTFRRPDAPMWDGGDPAGRSILLIAEQGWGDQVQFSRYARVLQSLGARVVFAVPARGRGLFDRLAGADLVVEGRRHPPHCDFYVPLLSIPHLLRITAETIPSDVPYLRADPGRVRDWNERLGGQGQFRVGLVWRETPGATLEAAYRDIPPAALVPLTHILGVRFYGLPLGAVPRELADDVVNLSSERDVDQAFEDTAAIVQNLDLVIAPDTVYCHIAGALGRPVWTLLSKEPDWRWPRTDETTPWYPTMRLFRQTTTGRWDDVIARVARELLRIGKRPSIR
jgi:Tfp pilus assembly protein PilF